MSSRVKAIESVTLTMQKSNPQQYAARVDWTAHRGGWSQLRLEATADPKDGFRNLQLLADWSEVGTGETKTETSHFFLGLNESGDLGVRIHAQENAMVARFDAIGSTTSGVGDAFPWNIESDTPAQMRLTEVIGRPIRVIKPGDVVLPVVVPGRVTICVDQAYHATDVFVEASLPAA